MSFSLDRKRVLERETSLSDLIQSFSNVINDKNPDLNAVSRLSLDIALQQAEQVQQKVDSGKAGKLAGAVFGIKEAIVEKGKISSASSKILEHYESVFDATVIERLHAEDALFLARTNMDEFAMGSSTENSAFVTTKNAHNTQRVPGGSSGGSATAVASGMVNVALGSDTGGSIRQPAAFSGIVGLKPTYGRVSRYGLIAYASSFDSIGPLTNSVEDATQILSVIAGQDAHDATTAAVQVGDYPAALSRTDALKIGVPEEYFGEGLDSEIRERVEQTMAMLKAQGHRLVPISLPNLKYAIATYYVLVTAEASSNLARFDGIRYGHRADAKQVVQELSSERDALQVRIKNADSETKKDLEAALKKMDSTLVRLYKNSRTEGFGAEVKRRIILGTYVLSSGYYDAYYGKAQRIRRLIQQDFLKAFQSVDVIISPTTPTTAFEIGKNMDDPLAMYLNDIYTISANLAGICGISVPAGFHSDGLPIGVQFMGKPFSESDILYAASLVEKQSYS